MKDIEYEYGTYKAVQFTDDDMNSAFFKAYLNALYNTYLDGIDESTLAGLFSGMTQDEQDVLMQLVTSMKSDPD